MASDSYVFQIELAETEGTPSAALAAGRLPAIIVEVRPEGLRQAAAGPERDKAERAAAESVARTAAPEALGNLIPPGSELVADRPTEVFSLLADNSAAGGGPPSQALTGPPQP